jgi:Golgi nucleoside diphosphatase
MTVQFPGHKRNLLQFIQKNIQREVSDNCMELADTKSAKRVFLLQKERGHREVMMPSCRRYFKGLKP